MLETTFTTDTGQVRLTDALVFAPGQRGHDLGRDAPHELSAPSRESRAKSSSSSNSPRAPSTGSYARCSASRATAGDVRWAEPHRCSRRRATSARGRDDAASFVVVADQEVGFSLRWVPTEAAVPPTPTTPADAPARIADTVEAWRSWESEHDIYDGPHRELVRLSSRVLKGLTYRPTGAIVAAPTTSLPETVGGERNWDYRYAWIRDASLTLQALYIGSCPDEAAEFVSFMTSAAGGGASLQIMYGIGGEHDLTERELPHLPAGASPPRFASATARGARRSSTSTGSCSTRSTSTVSSSASCIPRSRRSWLTSPTPRPHAGRETDAGMWEMRGEPRHHLSSKVLCWVALDRAVKLAPVLGPHAKTEKWAAGARRDPRRGPRTRLERGAAGIRAVVRLRRARRRSAAHAARRLPAGDRPRMRSTIEAIAGELTEDGLVLRYRNDEGLNADGLVGEEGTFVICSFWLVSCLAQAGEVERAEELFDSTAGYANDLGLLAEEIDTANGEQLGNFPRPSVTSA